MGIFPKMGTPPPNPNPSRSRNRNLTLICKMQMTESGESAEIPHFEKRQDPRTGPTRRPMRKFRIARPAVASMREMGMSTRAIASATGNSRNTIKGDLREVGQIDPPESDPAPVTGTDGKTYTPKPRPEPEPEPESDCEDDTPAPRGNARKSPQNARTRPNGGRVGYWAGLSLWRRNWAVYASRSLPAKNRDVKLLTVPPVSLGL